MKKYSTLFLFALPLSALANPFSHTDERAKLQYLADLTKRTPQVGAIAYQLDAYFMFKCDNSATLAQLKRMMKTKSVDHLLAQREERKVIGINKISSTFQSFNEKPPCKA